MSENCKQILKSGKNIGKQCGRKAISNGYCGYHKNSSAIASIDTTNVTAPVLIYKKMDTFLYKLPSVLLGYILSFDSSSIFNLALVNRECYRAINTLGNVFNVSSEICSFFIFRGRL